VGRPACRCCETAPPTSRCPIPPIFPPIGRDATARGSAWYDSLCNQAEPPFLNARWKWLSVLQTVKRRASCSHLFNGKRKTTLVAANGRTKIARSVPLVIEAFLSRHTVPLDHGRGGVQEPKVGVKCVRNHRQTMERIRPRPQTDAVSSSRRSAPVSRWE
jgi:hypothetical protein